MSPPTPLPTHAVNNSQLHSTATRSYVIPLKQHSFKSIQHLLRHSITCPNTAALTDPPLRQPATIMLRQRAGCSTTHHAHLVSFLSKDVYACCRCLCSGSLLPTLSCFEECSSASPTNALPQPSVKELGVTRAAVDVKCPCCRRRSATISDILRARRILAPRQQPQP